MRAPDFWRRRGLLSACLLPAGWVVAQCVRHRQKSAHPVPAPAPVICIGNLTVGGTITLNGGVLELEGVVSGSGKLTKAGGNHRMNLANGTTYTVSVVANNAVGAGPAATDTATPLAVPSAPQVLTLVANDSEIVANWAAPADDGGTAIVDYTVTITPADAAPGRMHSSSGWA